MNPNSITFQSRQQIRQHIRKLRKNLTALEQQQAARSIQQQGMRVITQIQAKNVALYLPVDGEIDTRPLITALWESQINVYLPVLHPFCGGHLLFLHYSPTTTLIPNKFGIFEPRLNVKTLLPTNQLDIIFTPLVAFDNQGNRLGMGGGFYDRTLQNWQQKGFLPIGLAHHCQKIANLPQEHWDIPLKEILIG